MKKIFKKIESLICNFLCKKDDCSKEISNTIKLKKESLEWSIKHLVKKSDTNIFPRPFEIDLFKKYETDVVDKLSKVNVKDYYWSNSRSSFIPKKGNDFRKVTQLSPIDSLFLSAIVYEIGRDIQKEREKYNKNIFSNIFSPSKDWKMYKNNYSKFLEKLYNLSKSSFSKVIKIDIQDFYNQIYHHGLENVLSDIKINKNYITAIMNCFKTQVSLGVSRGIPAGPHSTHILAEAVLIEIDKYLSIKNLKFLRYSDDFYIFLHEKDDESEIIKNFCKLLNSLGGLTINSSKTKIKKIGEFKNYLEKKIKYFEKNEKDLYEAFDALGIDLNRFFGSIYSDFSDEELECSMVTLSKVDRKKLFEEVFNQIKLSIEEIKSNQCGYEKLEYLLEIVCISNLINYQIVEILLNNTKYLKPISKSICNFLLSSCSSVSPSDIDVDVDEIGINSYIVYNKNLSEDEKNKMGEKLYDLLSKENLGEYTRLIIIGFFRELFDELGNTNKIISLYKEEQSEKVRRELILLAAENDMSSFLESLFADFYSLDFWNKNALLFNFEKISGSRGSHIVDLLLRNKKIKIKRNKEFHILETILRKKSDEFK